MRLARLFAAPTLLHVTDDRGTGPPVILIHGIASTSATFRRLIPLIEKTHRCISIDLMGFGESPSPPSVGYTVDEHAAAIERTVRSLRLETPAVLVGHSMGSIIAARYAVRYPRNLEKVVLVSPPIYLAPNELGRSVDRLAMSLYLKSFEYLRLHKRFTIRRIQALRVLHPFRDVLDLSERSWVPFERSLHHSIESQTTISDLAETAVPAAVVYGSCDEFQSRGAMRVVSRLSGVTVRRVYASGHLIGHRLARAVASEVG